MLATMTGPRSRHYTCIVILLANIDQHLRKAYWACPRLGASHEAIPTWASEGCIKLGRRHHSVLHLVHHFVREWAESDKVKDKVGGVAAELGHPSWASEASDA